MARSRRRGQQGRRKVGAGKRHRQKPRQAVRQGQPATPKIPASNSKSHLLYLHSNGGLSSPNTPVALPLTPCVCQIFILRIGSQDLLISMRAAAGPSAANECKDQARHQSRLDGCPEGPLQQGNRLKSAWKSEHQGTQEDTKTPEVSLTRKAEREEAGAEKGAHRTLSIVADTNRNQLWKGSAKRNYQLVKWQNEWVRERERGGVRASERRRRNVRNLRTSTGCRPPQPFFTQLLPFNAYLIMEPSVRVAGCFDFTLFWAAPFPPSPCFCVFFFWSSPLHRRLCFAIFFIRVWFVNFIVFT